MTAYNEINGIRPGIWIAECEADMTAYGHALSAVLVAGDWVAIDGPLGAGKTVLCKAIIQGLGFDGEVSSPSYALVHPYDPPDVRVPVRHADLYRLDNLGDLDELGLDDASGDCITLVEWAKRGGLSFGNPSYWIEITPLSGERRQIDMKRNNERIE
ncbi:MAG: tRNA (adenosine(37)-N6)-threonylcarbamoyltransferase complex ATPase subunit type 1 TsaE [Sphingorhabdus sp.]|nr:tRNA (adenosine(37)-N6)-threonylcarbamoyltransferase complex ATPase subunit type 1 TsaE [Sphingorhabdus sp.]